MQVALKVNDGRGGVDQIGVALKYDPGAGNGQ